jgi:hypothetical protein
MDDVNIPVVLEWKVMGLGVDCDGEVMVQNCYSGFYMRDYLYQNIFNCSKSS